MTPSPLAPTAATCRRAEQLAAGRATQTERKRIKARLKLEAMALSEDQWYEVVEAGAVAKVPVVEFLQWLPRLGQGTTGASTAAIRMVDAAGIGRTRLMGEVTLRQSAALVHQIMTWQGRR